ncbi:hypothetical protein [Pseudomonas lundensis]|uniref:hypothetical protein n=1 Tax=Pseudomonas lundensis TaxID=86185 RepID=UPI00147321B9|nr:hypothetical protein [Pseudomonas lundensis]NMZ96754.1 hypothetical protein [Pseudomonas lundensis]
MGKNSDSIFQLSLTEIAFTLIFMLLMILGWMYFDAQKQRLAAESKLEQLGSLEAMTQALDQLKAEHLGKMSAADADEVISRLVESAPALKEKARLQAQITDMDAQLSSLDEVKRTLEKAKAALSESFSVDSLVSALSLKDRLEQKITEHQAEKLPGDAQEQSKQAAMLVQTQVTTDEIIKQTSAALELKYQLEQHLGKEFADKLVPGQEQSLAQGLAEAVRTNQTKENSDLRGQLAYLKAKLEARGGRDYPPCWANEQTGKVEYLFNIMLTSGGIEVAAGWLESRNSDAMALPGISQLVGKKIALTSFGSTVQQIFDLSVAKNCRHYVVVRNQISDLAYFNKNRFAVGNYFYMYEPR